MCIPITAVWLVCCKKKTGAKIYLSAAAFEEYQHFRQADSAVNAVKEILCAPRYDIWQIDMVIEEYEDIRGIITEFNADNYLQNNEIREFGDWKFEVIFTPGHAAGHTCFFSERRLFAGR